MNILCSVAYLVEIAVINILVASRRNHGVRHRRGGCGFGKCDLLNGLETAATLPV